jgi:hypothetical protein
MCKRSWCTCRSIDYRSADRSSGHGVAVVHTNRIESNRIESLDADKVL